MNLFSRLFQNKAEVPAVAKETFVKDENRKIRFMVLFDSLPRLELRSIQSKLTSNYQINSALRFENHVADNGSLHVVIYLEQLQFRLVGFDLPAPKESVERSISCSHWSQDEKTILRHHKAHVAIECMNGEADATVQIAACLKLINTLSDQSLVGIVDDAAWNCWPARVLAFESSTSAIESASETLPLGLWNGFVKFFKSQDEVWYCTKGLHRWGVPDFAYLGSSQDADKTLDWFTRLFDHARKTNSNFEVGDTCTLSESARFVFVPVTEYAEYLDGPLKTLVLEKQ
jgi:hypothetical protein